jgi:hypothetical protein
MAKPHYMLCSEGRIVDRTTGLVTYYNVLEQLILSIGRPTGVSGESTYLRFVITAVWMRDPDEEETTYEFETYMHIPGGHEPRRIHAGDFQFGRRHFHRLEVFFQGSPVPTQEEAAPEALRLQTGVMRLESRIRPKDSTEWLSQEYRIPLQIQRVPAELTESSRNDGET